MERNLKAIAFTFAAMALPQAALAQGTAPWRAYVSNERSSTISVMDVASGTIVAEWPVGKRPRGIALTRDGK